MGECGMRVCVSDVSTLLSNATGEVKTCQSLNRFSFKLFNSLRGMLERWVEQSRIFTIKGGFVEFVNLDSQVYVEFKKMISAKLCSTVLGQAVIDCVVNPPRKGDPSYELWNKERTQVLASLKERAEMVSKVYNAIEGVSCNTVTGAMYAFPRIHLPKKAIEKAKVLFQPISTVFTPFLVSRCRA